jgi:hypothetical protein
MEIGAWKGDFSRETLKYLNPVHLYLVDPWAAYCPFSIDDKESYSARWYGGSIAKSQEDMEKIYTDIINEFGLSLFVLHKKDRLDLKKFMKLYQ